jgi:hypothetical protein
VFCPLNDRSKVYMRVVVAKRIKSFRLLAKVLSLENKGYFF